MGDSRTSSGVLLRFDEPSASRSVVLEDDGRVAYAYLLDEEAIVGDVWLYNVAETPDSVDWKDQSKMPFLNPRSLCKSEDVPRLDPNSSIFCRWSKSGVEIAIDGVLMARLKHGAKPGWSRLALRAGPLAKPLESGAGE